MIMTTQLQSRHPLLLSNRKFTYLSLLQYEISLKEACVSNMKMVGIFFVSAVRSSVAKTISLAKIMNIVASGW